MPTFGKIFLISDVLTHHCESGVKVAPITIIKSADPRYAENEIMRLSLQLHR